MVAISAILTSRGRFTNTGAVYAASVYACSLIAGAVLPHFT